jgi:phosphoribosyl 1,2-cyclic phosphodiesterase
MNVSFWGTRGSLATPGRATLRYGGNTSCVQVTGPQGTVLVLDAGTGIRELGASLPPGLKRVDVLLSHLHMDHIQGLGFFAALYNPNMEVHIWGPASVTLHLPARLIRYLSPPLFPVHMRDLPSKLFLHDAARMDEQIGEFRVKSVLVCHPGPTVGFRIEGAAGSVCYLPDHEPILGAEKFVNDPAWISGMAVAEGVDMLIHDSQYTDEEYRARVGWGHSSMRQAIRFANLAGIGSLVAFHHDPLHNDDVLEEMHRSVIAELSPSYPITVASEGSTLAVQRR